MPFTDQDKRDLGFDPRTVSPVPIAGTPASPAVQPAWTPGAGKSTGKLPEVHTRDMIEAEKSFLQVEQEVIRANSVLIREYTDLNRVANDWLKQIRERAAAEKWGVDQLRDEIDHVREFYTVHLQRLHAENERAINQQRALTQSRAGAIQGWLAMGKAMIQSAEANAEFNIRVRQTAQNLSAFTGSAVKAGEDIDLIRTRLRLTREEFDQFRESMERGVALGIDTTQLAELTRELQNVYGHSQGIAIAKNLVEAQAQNPLMQQTIEQYGQAMNPRSDMDAGARQQEQERLRLEIYHQQRTMDAKSADAYQRALDARRAGVEGKTGGADQRFLESLAGMRKALDDISSWGDNLIRYVSMVPLFFLPATLKAELGILAGVQTLVPLVARLAATQGIEPGAAAKAEGGGFGRAIKDLWGQLGTKGQIAVGAGGATAIGSAIATGWMERIRSDVEGTDPESVRSRAHLSLGIAGTKVLGGIGGGAASGAMLGTMVAPGAGTVPGAVIGGVVGGLTSLASATDDLKTGFDTFKTDAQLASDALSALAKPVQEFEKNAEQLAQNARHGLAQERGRAAEQQREFVIGGGATAEEVRRNSDVAVAGRIEQQQRALKGLDAAVENIDRNIRTARAGGREITAVQQEVRDNAIAIRDTQAARLQNELNQSRSIVRLEQDISKSLEARTEALKSQAEILRQQAQTFVGMTADTSGATGREASQTARLLAEEQVRSANDAVAQIEDRAAYNRRVHDIERGRLNQEMGEAQRRAQEKHDQELEETQRNVERMEKGASFGGMFSSAGYRTPDDMGEQFKWLFTGGESPNVRRHREELERARERVNELKREGVVAPERRDIEARVEKLQTDVNEQERLSNTERATARQRQMTARFSAETALMTQQLDLLGLALRRGVQDFTAQIQQARMQLLATQQQGLIVMGASAGQVQSLANQQAALALKMAQRAAETQPAALREADERLAESLATANNLSRQSAVTRAETEGIDPAIAITERKVQQHREELAAVPEGESFEDRRRVAREALAIEEENLRALRASRERIMEMDKNDERRLRALEGIPRLINQAEEKVRDREQALSAVPAGEENNARRQSAQEALNTARQNLDRMREMLVRGRTQAGLEERGGGEQRERARTQHETTTTNRIQQSQDLFNKAAEALLRSVTAGGDVERRQIDTRRNILEQERGLAEYLGSSFNTILDIQKEIVEQEAERYRIAKDELRRMEEAARSIGMTPEELARQETYQKQQMEVAREGAELAKKTIGAQRDFIDKALGRQFGVPTGSRFAPVMNDRFIFGEHMQLGSMRIRGNIPPWLQEQILGDAAGNVLGGNRPGGGARFKLGADDIVSPVPGTPGRPGLPRPRAPGARPTDVPAGLPPDTTELARRAAAATEALHEAQRRALGRGMDPAASTDVKVAAERLKAAQEALRGARMAAAGVAGNAQPVAEIGPVGGFVQQIAGDVRGIYTLMGLKVPNEGGPVVPPAGPRNVPGPVVPIGQPITRMADSIDQIRDMLGRVIGTVPVPGAPGAPVAPAGPRPPVAVPRIEITGTVDVNIRVDPDTLKLSVNRHISRLIRGHWIMPGRAGEGIPDDAG
jgi:hypothetical protein